MTVLMGSEVKFPCSLVVAGVETFSLKGIEPPHCVGIDQFKGVRLLRSDYVVETWFFGEGATRVIHVAVALGEESLRQGMGGFNYQVSSVF